MALSWRDAIEFLVLSSIDTDDFKSDDLVMLSTDEEHVFRLFVSKSTLFFDHSREIDIYIIPILKIHDAGDPTTTYLAKAAAVALRYRALFLEEGSPYTSLSFNYALDDRKFKATARDLLKELRILFVMAHEARLGEARNIAELFGEDSAALETVRTMSKKWNKQKLALSAAVEKLFMSLDGQLTAEDRKGFVATLNTFRGSLRSMNKTYLGIILRRLQAIVDASSDRRAKEGQRKADSRAQVADHSTPPP